MTSEIKIYPTIGDIVEESRRLTADFFNAKSKYRALLDHGIKSVYISNRMRGLPDYGESWFRDTAKALRAIGILVYCPLELDEVIPLNHPAGKHSQEAWRAYMVRDINLLLEAKPDAILLGPQWRDSPGANVEAAIAPVINAKVFMEEDGRHVPLIKEGVYLIELSRRLFS